MANQTGSCDIVVNSLLCFVLTKYKKLEVSKLISTVCGFYSADEVYAAKKQLLADVKQRSFFVNDVVYLTHTGYQSAEYEMEDTVDLLDLITEDNLLHRLPTYVTDSSEKVPSIKLDDGDLAFLLAKIDKMGAAIESLHNVVHTLLSHTTAGKPTVTATTRPTHCLHGPPGTQAKDRTYVAINTALAPGVHERSGNPTNVNVNNVQTAQPPLTETITSANDNSDDFQVHESSRHRKQRVRQQKKAAAASVSVSLSSMRQPLTGSQLQKCPASAAAARAGGKHSRQPLLVGTQTTVPTGNRVVPVTAARTFKSVYCVDNVNKNIDGNALVKFINRRLGVRVLTCFSITPRQTRWQRAHGVTPDCRAFRICINRADNAKFMDATKWPADITISQWYTIRINDANDAASENVDNNAAATAAALNVEEVGGNETDIDALMATN